MGYSASPALHLLGEKPPTIGRRASFFGVCARATLPGMGDRLPASQPCGELGLRRAVSTRAKEWAAMQLKVRANPLRKQGPMNRSDRPKHSGVTTVSAVSYSGIDISSLTCVEHVGGLGTLLIQDPHGLSSLDHSYTFIPRACARLRR